MTDAELREYFDFTESDLTANRSGRLTPGQKEKLDTQLKACKGNYWNRGLIVVIALGIFVAVIAAVLLRLPAEFSSFISPRMFVGPIGIIVVLVILFMRSNKTVNTAVKKAEGPARTRSSERRFKSTRYAWAARSSITSVRICRTLSSRAMSMPFITRATHSEFFPQSF